MKRQHICLMLKCDIMKQLKKITLTSLSKSELGQRKMDMMRVQFFHSAKVLFSCALISLFWACGNGNQSQSKALSDVAGDSSAVAVESDMSSQGETIVDGSIYGLVAMGPVFSGGERELLAYLGKQLGDSEYSKRARRHGPDAKVVFVRFVISSNGKVREPKILRSLDAEHDQKALDIVSAMPDWIPAQHEGKNVSVYYTLPIFFK